MSTRRAALYGSIADGDASVNTANSELRQSVGPHSSTRSSVRRYDAEDSLALMTDEFGTRIAEHYAYLLAYLAMFGLHARPLFGRRWCSALAFVCMSLLMLTNTFVCTAAQNLGQLTRSSSCVCVWCVCCSTLIVLGYFTVSRDASTPWSNPRILTAWLLMALAEYIVILLCELYLVSSNHFTSKLFTMRNDHYHGIRPSILRRLVIFSLFATANCIFLLAFWIPLISVKAYRPGSAYFKLVGNAGEVLQYLWGISEFFAKGSLLAVCACIYLVSQSICLKLQALTERARAAAISLQDFVEVHHQITAELREAEAKLKPMLSLGAAAFLVYLFEASFAEVQLLHGTSRDIALTMYMALSEIFLWAIFFIISYDLARVPAQHERTIAVLNSLAVEPFDVLSNGSRNLIESMKTSAPDMGFKVFGVLINRLFLISFFFLFWLALVARFGGSF